MSDQMYNDLNIAGGDSSMAIPSPKHNKPMYATDTPFDGMYKSLGGDWSYLAPVPDRAADGRPVSGGTKVIPQ